MNKAPAEWIYLDGEWLPWNRATIHVSTHGLHYGSSVFEGIRAYKTPSGPAIFRLPEHVKRLRDSAKLMYMDLGAYDQERLEELCVEAVARNGFESCYLRPLVFRGAAGPGLYPLNVPVSVCVYAVAWGRYLGEDAIENGIDAMVSSWRRFNAGTSMPLGKIGGQYVTSQMVSVESRAAGFGEGIMLDERGNVCEGAGENLIMVKDGAVITPPTAASILSGITRDSALRIAADLGFKVEHQPISRDMLYVADELFMTGTAAEITPVRSVDRISVGDGRRGPITRAIQERFFGIVNGELEDQHGWLRLVTTRQAVAATTA